MSDTEDTPPEAAPDPEPVDLEPPDPGEIPLETITANDDFVTPDPEPDPGPITLQEAWRSRSHSGGPSDDD